MAHYLYQGTYSSEALRALLKKPTNRFDVVRSAVEKSGGSIEGGWLSFGEYDVVLIVEMPDNVSAAALSLAFAAGGAVSGKTTPLLSQPEGVAAMKRAASSGYRAPGK